MRANPFLLLVICLLSVFVTVLYSISAWNRGQLRKMETEKPSQEDPLLDKRVNSTTAAAQFSGELISSAISFSTTTASTATSPATQRTSEEPPDRNRGKKLHYTVFHFISQKKRKNNLILFFQYDAFVIDRILNWTLYDVRTHGREIKRGPGNEQ